jgi:hypothetical protein
LEDDVAASEGLRDEQLDGILERDGGSEVGYSEEPVEVRVLVREIRSLRAALAASAAERASLREGLEQIAGMGRHSHLLSEPGNCACTADMALAAFAATLRHPAKLGFEEAVERSRTSQRKLGRAPAGEAVEGEVPAWAAEYVDEHPKERESRCRCKGCQGPPFCRCCNGMLGSSDFPDDMLDDAPPSPDDQTPPAPSSLGCARDGSGQAGPLPTRLALGASSADRPQEHAWHPINYWRWPLWKCQRCKMQTKHVAAAAIACQPTRLGYCRVCQVKAPTPTSLYCRLHRAESGKQRRKQRALSDAEMVALRDQGVTFKSIAERLEVSIPRARQLVREARAGLAGGQP